MSSEEEEDLCESCIRCEKGTDEGTMGFFVAVLVRDGVQERDSTAAQRPVEEEEDDEWNGFSDDAVELKESTTPAGSFVASKRSKKRKKKSGNT
jgi:putative methyltransferase